MNRTFLTILCLIVLLSIGFTIGCIQKDTGSGAPERSVLTIATTTSLYDTGLLTMLEDIYEKKNNVDLQITSQGTGKAIELAKRGDVDILLVHSPSQEIAFLDEGYGLNHRCLAYNYFFIIGPLSDPAGIRGLSPEAAFARIISLGMNKTPGISFVSRGDNSGTHSAEKNVWKTAGYNYTGEVQRSGAWYIEAGKGMGETLVLASEKGAYTLTDEGTYLTFERQLNLTALVKSGDLLLNRYSVMAVNPEKHPGVNIIEANRFINWLISDEGKQIIGNFGKEKYGKGLFTPLENDKCSKAPFSCDCTTSIP